MPSNVSEPRKFSRVSPASIAYDLAPPMRRPGLGDQITQRRNPDSGRVGRQLPRARLHITTAERRIHHGDRQRCGSFQRGRQVPTVSVCAGAIRSSCMAGVVPSVGSRNQRQAAARFSVRHAERRAGRVSGLSRRRCVCQGVPGRIPGPGRRRSEDPAHVAGPDPGTLPEGFLRTLA
ncbi:hypothetical protein D3C86_1528150 [compost metagenome]